MNISTNIGTRAAVLLAGLATITCLSPSALASNIAGGALGGDQSEYTKIRAVRCVEVNLGKREERLLAELARIHRVSVEAELAKIIEEELGQ